MQHVIKDCVFHCVIEMKAPASAWPRSRTRSGSGGSWSRLLLLAVLTKVVTPDGLVGAPRPHKGVLDGWEVARAGAAS